MDDSDDVHAACSVCTTPVTPAAHKMHTREPLSAKFASSFCRRVGLCPCPCILAQRHRRDSWASSKAPFHLVPPQQQQ